MYLFQIQASKVGVIELKIPKYKLKLYYFAKYKLNIYIL